MWGKDGLSEVAKPKHHTLSLKATQKQNTKMVEKLDGAKSVSGDASLAKHTRKVLASMRHTLSYDLFYYFLLHSITVPDEAFEGRNRKQKLEMKK